MSEYTGGPLDALASLFMEALRADEPAGKKRLIDEWNETIKRCNSVLMLKPELPKDGKMTDDLNGYVSPINMIITQTKHQVEEQQGQILMRAVHEAGFDVDQHELMRALKHDREQYKKGYEDAMKNAVPLDKLCELLAEMYHCPSSGWPSSGCACHPGCPDEAFEKLCGTDCDKHTDEERWKAFLTKWMEERENDHREEP